MKPHPTSPEMSTEADIVLRECPCCDAGAIWSRRTVSRFLYATTTRTEEWQASCGDGCVKTHWSDSRSFTAEKWNRRPHHRPAASAVAA